MASAEAVTAILWRVAHNWNREVDEQLVGLWCEAFASVDDRVLAEAARIAVDNDQFFPPVAQMKTYVGAVLRERQRLAYTGRTRELEAPPHDCHRGMKYDAATNSVTPCTECHEGSQFADTTNEYRAFRARQRRKWKGPETTPYRPTAADDARDWVAGARAQLDDDL